MPCWQQVKIEAAIRLKDKALLKDVLKELDATIEGNLIRRGGLQYFVGEDGSVSASVSTYDAEEAGSFFTELKREYALATLSQWDKGQRFNVRRQGNKLKARRWV